jgi:hypothetical protein
MLYTWDDIYLAEITEEERARLAEEAAEGEEDNSN